MDYRQKYLKYKAKYVALKNMIGGDDKYTLKVIINRRSNTYNKFIFNIFKNIDKNNDKTPIFIFDTTKLGYSNFKWEGGNIKTITKENNIINLEENNTIIKIIVNSNSNSNILGTYTFSNITHGNDIRNIKTDTTFENGTFTPKN